MTFEQWCHSIGIEETRINKTDLVSMEILKECWDYKEMEIQKIVDENSDLRQILINAGYLEKDLDFALRYMRLGRGGK